MRAALEVIEATPSTTPNTALHPMAMKLASMLRTFDATHTRSKFRVLQGDQEDTKSPDSGRPKPSSDKKGDGDSNEGT